MQKVVELQPKKHVYEVDHCSGCGGVIEGEYTELGLPSYDGLELKHIALCGDCTEVGQKEGVI